MLITFWWLSRDRGIPSADAGSHLFTAVGFHDLLARGEFGAIWTRSGYYPPLTFLVGGLSTLVAGINVWSPVIGENLVYVTLLAAGCYGTAHLVAGARAGFLAVLFALGSPLLIEQFHVFMIDAPEAALVAAAVWLILRSDRFARTGPAAAAGLVVGLGLNSKEQFPLFIAGLLFVLLLRGRGWRNRRGAAAFALAALVVAIPWYAINWDMLGRYAAAGLANANLPPRGKPPLVSVSNLGWYLWAVLNGLLFAPLSAAAAVGVVLTAARIARAAISRQLRTGFPSDDYRPELLGGLLVGWLGITLTPHHDMRYAMPLIVYLAVLGTLWIAELGRPLRRPAIAVLSIAVVATTLGASFGAGSDVRILLAGHPVVTDVSFGIPAPDQITVYANHDFVVSAPRRRSDVPGFLADLRASGISGVQWIPSDFEIGNPAADPQGLIILLRSAGIGYPGGPGWRRGEAHVAFLIHHPEAIQTARAETAVPPPCLHLEDGTGVWVALGKDLGESKLRFVCPGPRRGPQGDAGPRDPAIAARPRSRRASL